MATPSVRVQLNPYERRLQEIVETERLKRDARRRLAAEERGDVVLPPFESLNTRLARPRSATRWRIERWQPQGSRVVLAAQHKAGKTTARDNLIRSLVDGDPWLGEYAVTPVTGTVLVLDFELSDRMAEDWLSAQRIREADRVILITMRHRAASFNLLDPEIRAMWAHAAREFSVEHLTIDCARPILDAIGLDEQREAGQFLTALDAFAHEARIPDLLLIQHFGHNGERSRGDSRFRDYPDVEWRLVRQDENPASARFISAYGRDVDLPETQLLFDQATRRLTVTGGSRRDAGLRAALDSVVQALVNSPEALSLRGIQAALAGSDHSRDLIRAAVKAGTRAGTIRAEPGKRGAILHRAGVRGEGSARSAIECAAPLIEGRTHRTLLDVSTDTAAVRTVEGVPT